MINDKFYKCLKNWYDNKISKKKNYNQYFRNFGTPPMTMIMFVATAVNLKVVCPLCSATRGIAKYSVGLLSGYFNNFNNILIFFSHSFSHSKPIFSNCKENEENSLGFPCLSCPALPYLWMRCPWPRGPKLLYNFIFVVNLYFSEIRSGHNTATRL